MTESMMDIKTRTDWPRVLLFVGAGMMAAFQIGKAPPVLPVLREELVFGLFIAGWVLSAFNVVGTLFSSAVGSLADWLGHRRMILSGLVCQVVGCLAGSMSIGPGLLLASRFLEGLGYILITVSAPSLVIRLIRPRDFRLAFGVWGCFMPAGGAVMMLLAPILVDLSGWRGLWIINAALLSLFTIVFGLLTRDLAGSGHRGRFSISELAGDVWSVIKSKGPLILAFCFCTYAVQFIAVIGFLPTMLIEEEHLSPTLAAALSALVLTLNAFGNLMGGRLLDRGKKRWALIAFSSLVMGLSTFGIYSIVLPLSLRYLFCLLFSSVGGILPAVVLEGAAAKAPTPSLIATSSGLVMQGAQAGLLAGPPMLAAFVVKMGGWETAPRLLCAFGLAGAALALALRFEERTIGQS